MRPELTTPAAPATAEPIRLQCRHIRTDGHRCGSPALRSADFCFYHHNARKPVPKAEAQERAAERNRRAAFVLPQPEDRSAIQEAIGQVILKLAANELDPKRAGLLLYGLQIASCNLPRQKEQPDPSTTVEEVENHPEQGLIAPTQDFTRSTSYKKSFVELLEEQWAREEAQKVEQDAEKARRDAERYAEMPLHLDQIQAVSSTERFSGLREKNSRPSIRLLARRSRIISRILKVRRTSRLDRAVHNAEPANCEVEQPFHEVSTIAISAHQNNVKPLNQLRLGRSLERRNKSDNFCVATGNFFRRTSTFMAGSEVEKQVCGPVGSIHVRLDERSARLEPGQPSTKAPAAAQTGRPLSHKNRAPGGPPHRGRAAERSNRAEAVCRSISPRYAPPAPLVRDAAHPDTPVGTLHGQPCRPPCCL